MKLYGFWRSTATWRVRIALAYKDLAYELIPVNLAREGGGEQHDEGYRALNPMAQVPTLEILDNATELRLTQSLVILEYLEERYPDPPLLPRDRADRAQARRLAEIVNSGIQPLQNTGTQDYVRTKLSGDDRAWVRHWVGRGLAALEIAASQSAGRFAVGDSLSFADVCLVPELYFARRFAVDLEPYPTLLRIEAACVQLDAFVRAHAERQRDAPQGSQQSSG